VSASAETLLALLSLGQAQVTILFLVFLRVGAAMAVMPAFGEQSLPLRVRLAATLAFTAVVAPAIADRPVPPVVAFAILPEVLAGLILGLGLRLLVMALQTAGAIAAQSTSVSQLFAGAAGEPQPAIGNLLTLAGLALAVSAGLHVQAARLLVLSYDILPPGRMPGAADAAAFGLARVAQAFGLAFTLAAPFAAAAMLYTLATGVINRAMPQFMVALVGAPALSFGALALLLLTAPALLAVWQSAMNAALADPFGIAP
jgi:flagellar biosynthesis protein FliR